MATAFLALKALNGTTLGDSTSVGGVTQVQRYMGGSVTPVGVTFGSSDATFNSGLDHTRRKIIQVPANGYTDRFIATTGMGIWRSNDAGVTWVQVHTFPAWSNPKDLNVVAMSERKSGFFTVQSAAGAPVLVMLYSGVSGISAVKSTDFGETWTAYGSVPGDQDLGDACVFRGKACVMFKTTKKLITFDHDANTVSSITDGTLGGFDNISFALVPFNDRLISIAQVNYNSYAPQIMSWETGVAVQVGVLPGTGTDWNTNGTYVIWAAFVDPNDGNLYLLAYRPNNGVSPGWRCFKITTAFVVTDVTSTVLPAGFQALTDSAHVAIVADNEGSPGSTPTIRIFTAPNYLAATGWTEWTWNGASSLVTAVSTSGSCLHALPQNVGVGDVSYWTSGEPAIQKISEAPVSGGLQIGFKLYGGGTKSVRLWHGSPTDAYPLSAGTLVGTSTGLTADGTTTYYITWLVPYSTGTRPKYQLEVY